MAAIPVEGKCPLKICKMKRLVYGPNRHSGAFCQQPLNCMSGVIEVKKYVPIYKKGSSKRHRGSQTP